MKISQDELYSLVKSLSDLPVEELLVKHEGLTIKIKHASSNDATIISKPQIVSEVASRKEEAEKTESNEDLGIAINAPISGTFYESPSPDEKSFIKVGDKVKKGQTICILEAMKMMNTVEIPDDGVITSIEVKNEDIVDAGQVLVRYKPC
jgi:acetyl-CoA carboxylase biotin carboxyl carrier protein